jgi:hypothetical protein
MPLSVTSPTQSHPLPSLPIRRPQRKSTPLPPPSLKTSVSSDNAPKTHSSPFLPFPPTCPLSRQASDLHKNAWTTLNSTSTISFGPTKSSLPSTSSRSMRRHSHGLKPSADAFAMNISHQSRSSPSLTPHGSTGISPSLPAFWMMSSTSSRRKLWLACMSLPTPRTAQDGSASPRKMVSYGSYTTSSPSMLSPFAMHCPAIRRPICGRYGSTCVLLHVGFVCWL